MSLENAAGGIQEVCDLWVLQAVEDGVACTARVNQILHPQDRELL